MAGDTLPEALLVARRINSQSISVTLDHLGENVTSLEEAAASRDVYLEALHEIATAGIRGNVSIKLTQFGMDLSRTACGRTWNSSCGRRPRSATSCGWTWSRAQYTSATLDLVTDLHARYGAVGTVIQAYLYRSRSDVETLCDNEAFACGCARALTSSRRRWPSRARPTWTATTSS